MTHDIKSAAREAAIAVRNSVCPYAGELAATIRETHKRLGTSDARTRKHKSIDREVGAAAKAALAELK